MTQRRGDALQGADVGTIRAAIESGGALPGTRGFAGRVDGTLVRDVLGRYPLYTDGGDPSTAGWNPSTLARPTPVPAGHAVDADGSRRLWELPRPSPVAPSVGIRAVRRAVATATDAVAAEGLALGFSGGVDSAVLAARLDVPCYVVGFPDGPDLDAARSAATLLDVDLRVVELDHGTLEAAVPAVARATGRRNAMDVSIALGLYALAERVAADGFDRLALGQGADELFGGYEKVARAPEDSRVEADTTRGARRETVETLPDGVPRDVLAVRAGGVEPVAPLLDDRVVAAALALPGEALVSPAGERKVALRRAVREWLPDRLAFREKRALQYGSRISRELDRLARQAGFKRRRDDHVRKYVDSLVGD